MAVEPVARWDPPATGRDPQSPQEGPAAPQPDVPLAERDPRTLKRDPVSPPRDLATAAAVDPKVRRRDPMEGGDPLVAEGVPGAECWCPGSAPAERPRRPPARTRLRNRRYAALRRLIQAGEYFSEEEMRAREPLLYQHYIGQYQEGGGGGDPCPGDPPSPCAPPRLVGPPPHPLTRLLLRSVEEAAVQQRLCRQRLRDGDSEEEEEPWVPNEAERALLREEFTSHMYQRFLDGEDGDFDYSQIDEDPDLDNLDIVSRDAEERYFDEEEPSNAPQLD